MATSHELAYLTVNDILRYVALALTEYHAIELVHNCGPSDIAVNGK